MAEARGLKRILRSFEKFKSEIAEFTTETSISEIRTYISLLVDDWREFQTLERLTKGKFDDANMEMVNKIEEIYANLKRKLFRLEKQHEEKQHEYSKERQGNLSVEESNFFKEISSINKRDSEVRLPRVSIPEFSGNYADFSSFRDLFETSVHNNESVSNVHKLQHLKSLLKGDAYALIKHLTVTEVNYDEAWNKVKARYNKPKPIVHTLLKRFLDQPNIQQGCAKSIRHLADVSDEVLRGLKVLGTQVGNRDPWLIYILVNKLDSDTKEAWAHETTEIDFPTLDRLFVFLNKRSDALESLSSLQRSKPHSLKRVNALVSHVAKFTCVLCAGEHYLGKCDQYLQLPITERKQLVVDKKLCFNCLSPSHQSVVCRSKYKCGKCNRKHHLTLHLEETPKPSSEGTISGNMLNTSESSSNIEIEANPVATHSFQSLLPTAIVEVVDEYGNKHKCRVLLDSGSQASFITEACMQRLKLPRSKANISITGLTSGKVITKGRASTTANSLHSSGDKIQVDVRIVNHLPNRLPSFNFTCKDVGFLNDVKLADPQYNRVGPVDILIGADRFFHILRDGRLINSSDTLVAQRTIFGWIVSGINNRTSIEPNDTVEVSSYTINLHLDVDLDHSLKRFFEQEEIPNCHIPSPEETECEEHYKVNHKRNDEGRYIVAIPFKKDKLQLGNSVNAAKRRFLTLERKLQANPSLKQQYVKAVNDYLKLGHLEIIKQADHNISEPKCFYLPHHCVLKQSSETTKLRVVFDGSAKSSTGVSLNDTMLVGPTIQPSLWEILMRFRNHKIALIGDIEKMYNQVLISEDDTQYQRILWRAEVSDELKHYKLNTVTFGLASSSFLAIRTLHQLAYDYQQMYPDIVPHVLNDFYVDDFISGADTIEEVQNLKEKVTELLRAGGFNLRKWKSNLSNIAATENVDEISTFHNSSSETKILGLQWNALDDAFTFRLCLESNGAPTKRQVISEYSKVFDPLGWLAPTIILMKIIFQSLWLMKLSWDDQLPDSVARTYKKMLSELKLLEKLKISRYVPQDGTIELHGFSDASEKAYSAVVYCRAVHDNGAVTVSLMAAKTKVAPIKVVSLPRLELCGAQLLAKLLALVKETINQPVKCYGWTDSTIVLMWLSSHPARWKTFVANRTSDILSKLPRKYWNHVKSENNPIAPREEYFHRN